MKVLVMDVKIMLPDDFEGNYNDAMQYYIDYRKAKNKPPIPEVDEDNICFGSMFLGEWTGEFWEELKQKEN